MKLSSNGFSCGDAVPPMFETDQAPLRTRSPWILVTSIALHCIVLFLVLRPPDATILKVQQLRQGNNGRTLARLYLKSDVLAEATASTDNKSKQEAEQTLRSKQLENPSKSLQLRMERHERVLAANRDEHSVNAARVLTPRLQARPTAR